MGRFYLMVPTWCPPLLDGKLTVQAVNGDGYGTASNSITVTP